MGRGMHNKHCGVITIFFSCCDCFRLVFRRWRELGLDCVRIQAGGLFSAGYMVRVPGIVRVKFAGAGGIVKYDYYIVIVRMPAFVRVKALGTFPR